jgi:hypothetical protein
LRLIKIETEIKERLPASWQVRDSFTFSNKIIKNFHNSIKEQLNVKERKIEDKKRKKIIADHDSNPRSMG